MNAVQGYTVVSLVKPVHLKGNTIYCIYVSYTCTLYMGVYVGCTKS